MAKLFDIVKSEVVLSPHILAIPAIKKIWDRDKSRGKSNAYKEISYIVFVWDFHSPYRDIFIDEREVLVKKDVFGDENWEPDKVVLTAVERYKKLQETPLTRLLEANMSNIDKLTEYLNTISFKDKSFEDASKTADGMMKGMERVGSIIKSLSLLRKQVQTEVAENTARGNTEIGLFELPD